MILPAGCSPSDRYRALSFFFDGVPVPAGLEHEFPEMFVGPEGHLLDPTDPRVQELIAQGIITLPTDEAEEEEELEELFRHKPYETRMCSECHEAQASFQAPSLSPLSPSRVRHRL